MVTHPRKCAVHPMVRMVCTVRLLPPLPAGLALTVSPETNLGGATYAGRCMSSKSSSAIMPRIMVVNVSVTIARSAYCSVMPDTRAMQTSMRVAETEYSTKRAGLMPRWILSL